MKIYRIKAMMREDMKSFHLLSICNDEIKITLCLLTIP